MVSRCVRLRPIGWPREGPQGGDRGGGSHHAGGGSVRGAALAPWDSHAADSYGRLPLPIFWSDCAGSRTVGCTHRMGNAVSGAVRDRHGDVGTDAGAAAFVADAD